MELVTIKNVLSSGSKFIWTNKENTVEEAVVEFLNMTSSFNDWSINSDEEIRSNSLKCTAEFKVEKLITL